MYKKRFCPKGHDTTLVGRCGSTCRVCHTEAGKMWAVKNPQRRDNASRNSNWKGAGILNADNSLFTYVDYDRAYQVQAGKCAGCMRHQSELKARLHVDHDHKTGRFRFLLCGECNRAIGIVREDPKLLRKLADLIED